MTQSDSQHHGKALPLPDPQSGAARGSTAAVARAAGAHGFSLVMLGRRA